MWCRWLLFETREFSCRRDPNSFLIDSSHHATVWPAL
jgi:hypothetical protein